MTDTPFPSPDGIQVLHLSQLSPDPDNAREHNPANIGMIVDALHQVGACRSGVVDENLRILAGNGTWEALAEAGIEEVIVVPSDGRRWVVVQRTDLDDDQKRRLSLYDNRAAELAGWNAARIRDFVAANDKAVEGILPADLVQRLVEQANAADREAEIEAAADRMGSPEPTMGREREVLEKWDVRTGQTWIVPSTTSPGHSHVLIVGRAEDPIVARRLLDGARPRLMVNDPPYGMRLDDHFPPMRSKIAGLEGSKEYEPVAGDDVDFDARPYLVLYGQVAEQFWFGADYYARTLPDTEHSGAWMVWDKRLDETADRIHGSCFELMWSRVRHRRRIFRHRWAGIFGLENEPEGTRKRVHRNQKPVPLIEELLRDYTDAGDVVLDLFAGSGTTIVAAERTGRLARVVELEPVNGALALERLAKMGLEPLLEGEL
ncbi:MAG: DNA methyltransferase [Sphingomonadaceae bacterium]